MGHKRHRWLRRSLIGIGVLFLLVVLAGIALDEPRPKGVPGPEADALARKMERAVGRDAWERTGAVTWSFSGRHEHLWDRARRLCRVRWGDLEVLERVDDRSGRAFKSGREVMDGERDALLTKAYKYWLNDAYWLNPVTKLFDEGTTRGIVMHEGAPALLVTHTSGGVTPGDAYLWIVGADGIPIAWKMWAAILPIGGLSTTWEHWITLRTGAKIATAHQMGPRRFELTGVRGGASIADVEPGPDPFAPLFEGPTTR